MILSIILIGCQTVSEPRPQFNVPAFPMMPERPVLEPIPPDTIGALKALTTNMSRLINDRELLEIYDEKKDAYYRSVIDIITR